MDEVKSTSLDVTTFSSPYYLTAKSWTQAMFLFPGTIILAGEFTVKVQICVIVQIIIRWLFIVSS